MHARDAEFPKADLEIVSPTCARDRARAEGLRTTDGQFIATDAGSLFCISVPSVHQWFKSFSPRPPNEPDALSPKTSAATAALIAVPFSSAPPTRPARRNSAPSSSAVAGGATTSLRRASRAERCQSSSASAMSTHGSLRATMKNAPPAPTRRSSFKRTTAERASPTKARHRHRRHARPLARPPDDRGGQGRRARLRRSRSAHYGVMEAARW